MGAREEILRDRYIRMKQQNPGVRITVPDELWNSKEFEPIRSGQNISSFLQQGAGSQEAKFRKQKYEESLFKTPQGLQRLAAAAGVKTKDVTEKKHFNPLAALSNVLNIVNPIDAIVRARETKAPDFFQQYLSSVGRRAKGAVKGQFVEEKTGTDLLKSFGVKQPTSKLGNIGIRTAGFGLDVLLDPLTYISFGAGAGAKVGGKVLTKAGGKAFRELAETTARKTAADLAKKGVQKPFEEILQGTIKNLSTKTIEEGSRTAALKPFLDQGGIKFMGKTVLPSETIRQAASSIALSRAGKAIGLEKAQKGFKAVGDVVGPLLFRDYRIPKEFRPFTQAYHTEVSNIKGTVAEDVVNVLKNNGLKKTLNADEQLAVAKAIDGRDFAGLSPKLAGVAQDYSKILDKIRDEDMAAGLLARSLENYLPLHYKATKGKINTVIRDVLQKSPERAQDLLDLDARVVRATPTATLRGAEQPRIVKDLQEAIDLGLEPETNPLLIVHNRLLASRMARAEKEFVDKARSEFLKKGKLPAEVGLTRITVPKVESAVTRGGELTKRVAQKEVTVPDFVAETLTNVRKRLVDDEAVNTILRGYDKMLSFYKGSLTTLFPAFHIRNGISNVVQNSLDIGLQALNPVLHGKTMAIMREGTEGVLKDSLGKSWTYQEIRDAMKKSGALSSDFFGKDIETAAEKALSLGVPKPFDVGRKVGSMVEDEARALNFVTNLIRTGSPEAAAARVNMFLFDYGNLSRFEKEVMKRLIPFYTFGRKNFELQLRTLLKDPKRIAMQFKAVQAATDRFTEEDRAALPQFAQESLGIKLGQDEFGRPRFITGLGLPIEEFAARLKGPESAKDVLAQTSPIIKFPLEMLSGKDLFTGRPIDEIQVVNEAGILPKELRDALGIREVKKDVYIKGVKQDKQETQYMANPRALWLLRQLPSSRFQNTIGQMTDPEKSLLQKAIRLTTGVKGYSFDEEQQKFFKERDQLRDVTDDLIRKGVLKRNTVGAPYIVVDPDTKKELANINDIIYNLPYKERPTSLQETVERAEKGDLVAKLMLQDIIEHPEIYAEAVATESSYRVKENVGPVPTNVQQAAQ